MRPDLVSIYAGANDILRPRIDIDALVAAYDVALGRLVDAGAHVVTFTAFDPAGFAVFGALRGRFAIYNELVRQVAEKHGAALVDFWRLKDYRDDRLWDVDRMHMSSAGHQRMAIAVLDTLGIDHDLSTHRPRSAGHLVATRTSFGQCRVGQGPCRAVDQAPGHRNVVG
ncbi:SGNH/GDSL hydrolase family protein [Aeromicrobium sp. UC242_57]|uniref:SGNH/GDSL hydrolase family protein n=1 Tax=Aeromicrobium sp. UC242_57 TaxID=3374624 RepID=UPI003795DB9B